MGVETFITICVINWKVVESRLKKLDPHQDINLMTNCIQKDIDRHCLTDIRQVILFPDWDEVDPTVKKMRQIKDSIWETGTRSEKIYRAFRYKAGRILLFIKGMTKNLR